MTVGGRRPSAGANLSARAHRLEEERTPALRIIFEPRASMGRESGEGSYPAS
jgi:hypothetical protein